MQNLTINPIKATAFGTIDDRRRMLNKKSFKDIVNIGSIATVFFIIADFVPLYIKWTAVQQDNWYFVALLAAVSAVILDLPMFLAGRALREYLDGLKAKSSMLSIIVPAVVAFFVAYVPFLIFSLTTKDATFEEALPLGVSTAFSFDNVSNEASNPMSVTIAAIFSAVLPLGTSISSLVVGLCTYRPIDERLKKLALVRTLAEEHRTALIEGNAQLSVREELLKKREEELFESFKREVYAQEQIRIQAYEEALEECLDADGILRVTENAFDLLESTGFDSIYAISNEDEPGDPVIEESKGVKNLIDTGNSFNTVA